MKSGSFANGVFIVLTIAAVVLAIIKYHLY